MPAAVLGVATVPALVGPVPTAWAVVMVSDAARADARGASVVVRVAARVLVPVVAAVAVRAAGRSEVADVGAVLIQDQPGRSGPSCRACRPRRPAQARARPPSTIKPLLSGAVRSLSLQQQHRPDADQQHDHRGIERVLDRVGVRPGLLLRLADLHAFGGELVFPLFQPLRAGADVLHRRVGAAQPARIFVLLVILLELAVVRVPVGPTLGGLVDDLVASAQSL